MGDHRRLFLVDLDGYRSAGPGWRGRGGPNPDARRRGPFRHLLPEPERGRPRAG